ncbi:MAG TPA: amidohydrolase family protein [Microthrixaceae bacterium]|nr:amidohydrolase family protein [Microthrixaceae bacterium]
MIRGGTLVDGSGRPSRTADVAVDGDRIVEVGRVEGSGRAEIDADGLLVTPGFVDIHTHYDGQVTWDELLTPSCWHGVTTAVMGNCGVGFAPVEPSRREWIVELMEGVEDIPGAALSAGIRWSWESFPEYLDMLDGLAHVLDVGTQVPHGAVRTYVMGDRGAANEPATPEDVAAMARLVAEGIEAGALGFSTSRTIMHTAVNGDPVPGTFAAEDELFGIGDALASVGRGVFELAPAGAMGEDLLAADREMAWMRRLAERIGRPVSFALTQNASDPDEWRTLMRYAEDARAAGIDVRPQVHARTVSLLIGLPTFCPLMFCDAWAEVALLDHDAQMAALRRPEVKVRFVAEMAQLGEPITTFMSPDRMFPLGDPPDYEPAPEDSVSARARRAGATGEEGVWTFLYDLLLGDDGRELLNSPILNYVGGNLDPSFEMLSSPVTAFGLGDGGAHAGQTCDASSTTFLLTHWARDRSRGPRLSVEAAVAKMTSRTAALYGLGDRGVVAPGLLADLNVIDFDGLQLARPELVHDLPGGAKRLIQRSSGYVSTVKSGIETFRDGAETGARPGRLVRGAR